MLLIHADDYGVSLHASRDIAELISNNQLDSTSIIPNMSCYETSIDLLKKALKKSSRKVELAIHLNLMEGHCVAESSKVPCLVDRDGYFVRSWGDLLKVSYQKTIRESWKKQIKEEIRAQIRRVRDDMESNIRFRIDSHQHTHMIPVVWEALTEVLEENLIQVSCVRIPDEPILPFLEERKHVLSYGMLNPVKHILLHRLAKHAKRTMPQFYQDSMKFWGLLMSGCMDEKRVEALSPYFRRYALDRKQDIEMVFHPGQTLKSEIGREYTKQGFIDDHLSANRSMEKKTIMQMERIKNSRGDGVL